MSRPPPPSGKGPTGTSVATPTAGSKVGTAALLPTVTASLRSEFIPLLQTLESVGSFTSNTYMIEIVFALVRFDAFLNRQERHTFVRAFNHLIEQILSQHRRLDRLRQELEENREYLAGLIQRCAALQDIADAKAREEVFRQQTMQSLADNLSMVTAPLDGTTGSDDGPLPLTSANALSYNPAFVSIHQSFARSPLTGTTSRLDGGSFAATAADSAAGTSLSISGAASFGFPAPLSLGLTEQQSSMQHALRSNVRRRVEHCLTSTRWTAPASLVDFARAASWEPTAARDGSPIAASPMAATVQVQSRAGTAAATAAAAGHDASQPQRRRPQASALPPLLPQQSTAGSPQSTTPPSATLRVAAAGAAWRSGSTSPAVAVLPAPLGLPYFPSRALGPSLSTLLSPTSGRPAAAHGETSGAEDALNGSTTSSNSDGNRHVDTLASTTGGLEQSPLSPVAATVEGLWEASFWSLLNGAVAAEDVALLYALLNARKKLPQPDAMKGSGAANADSGSPIRQSSAARATTPRHRVHEHHGQQQLQQLQQQQQLHGTDVKATAALLDSVVSGKATPVQWSLWFTMSAVLSLFTEGVLFDGICSPDGGMPTGAGGLAESQPSRQQLSEHGREADMGSDADGETFRTAGSAVTLSPAYADDFPRASHGGMRRATSLTAGGNSSHIPRPAGALLGSQSPPERSGTFDGTGSGGAAAAAAAAEGYMAPLREPSPEALALLQKVYCPSLRNFCAGLKNVAAYAPVLAARAAQLRTNTAAPRGSSDTVDESMIALNASHGSNGSAAIAASLPLSAAPSALSFAAGQQSVSRRVVSNRSNTDYAVAGKDGTAPGGSGALPPDSFALPVETGMFTRDDDSAVRPVDVVLHALVTALEVQLDAARASEESPAEELARPPGSLRSRENAARADLTAGREDGEDASGDGLRVEKASTETPLLDTTVSTVDTAAVIASAAATSRAAPHGSNSLDAAASSSSAASDEHSSKHHSHSHRHHHHQPSKASQVLGRGSDCISSDRSSSTGVASSSANDATMGDGGRAPGLPKSSSRASLVNMSFASRQSEAPLLDSSAVLTSLLRRSNSSVAHRAIPSPQPPTRTGEGSSNGAEGSQKPRSNAREETASAGVEASRTAEGDGDGPPPTTGLDARSRASVDGSDTALSDEDASDVHPQLLSLPAIMRAELTLLHDDVCTSLATVATMGEQVRSEASLLIFRVVSTVLDWLIPAVYLYDRRMWLFYRAWVCDLYGLMQRESLLDKFTAILDQDANEAAASMDAADKAGGTDGTGAELVSGRGGSGSSGDDDEHESGIGRDGRRWHAPPEPPTSPLLEGSSSTSGVAPATAAAAAAAAAGGRVARSKAGKGHPKRLQRQGSSGSPHPTCVHKKTQASRKPAPVAAADAVTASTPGAQKAASAQETAPTGAAAQTASTAGGVTQATALPPVQDPALHAAENNNDDDDDDDIGAGGDVCSTTTNSASASVTNSTVVSSSDTEVGEANAEDADVHRHARARRRRKARRGTDAVSYTRTVDPFALVVPGCNVEILTGSTARPASPADSPLAPPSVSFLILSRTGGSSSGGGGGDGSTVRSRVFERSVSNSLSALFASTVQPLPHPHRPVSDSAVAVRAAQALLDEGTLIPQPRQFMVTRLVSAAVRGMDPDVVRTLLAPFSSSLPRSMAPPGSRGEDNEAQSVTGTTTPVPVSGRGDGVHERRDDDGGGSSPSNPHAHAHDAGRSRVAAADNTLASRDTTDPFRPLLPATDPQATTASSASLSSPAGSAMERHTTMHSASTASARGQRASTSSRHPQAAHSPASLPSQTGGPFMGLFPGVSVSSPRTVHPVAPGHVAESSSLVHHHRFRYPVVRSADDIGQLYRGTLSEAELMLSPHDPLRAALVQSMVNYLVDTQGNPRAALRMLDDYLFEVGEEPVQVPVMKRVALSSETLNTSGSSRAGTAGARGTRGGVESSGATGGGNAFSVTSVRQSQARQTGPVKLASSRPAAATPPPAGSRSTALDGALATPADAAGPALPAGAGQQQQLLPLVPTIIPSWSVEDERVQFTNVLQLLRRTQDQLRALVGAS